MASAGPVQFVTFCVTTIVPTHNHVFVVTPALRGAPIRHSYYFVYTILRKSSCFVVATISLCIA
jgi:hypothetical protein